MIRKHNFLRPFLRSRFIVLFVVRLRAVVLPWSKKKKKTMCSDNVVVHSYTDYRITIRIINKSKNNNNNNVLRFSEPNVPEWKQRTISVSGWKRLRADLSRFVRRIAFVRALTRSIRMKFYTDTIRTVSRLSVHDDRPR